MSTPTIRSLTPLARAASAAPRAATQRWLGPVFVALAQLMIALDATIMNVALPSLQRSLGFADDERQWVITAYTVTFGSLLLLGGRLSDRIGHSRAFSIGLFGFASVSALGGASNSLWTLCAARAARATDHSPLRSVS